MSTIPSPQHTLMVAHNSLEEKILHFLYTHRGGLLAPLETHGFPTAEYGLPSFTGNQQVSRPLPTAQASNIRYALLRPGRESDPRMRVLQTPVLPLHHQAYPRNNNKQTTI